MINQDKSPIEREGEEGRHWFLIQVIELCDRSYFKPRIKEYGTNPNLQDGISFLEQGSVHLSSQIPAECMKIEFNKNKKLDIDSQE